MIYKLFKTNQFKRFGSGKKYKDHSLIGDYADFMECHIKPDLLLIYRFEESILKLVDIGTHSELFD